MEELQLIKINFRNAGCRGMGCLQVALDRG
jgi:hypothetical protein